MQKKNQFSASTAFMSLEPDSKGAVFEAAPLDCLLGEFSVLKYISNKDDPNQSCVLFLKYRVFLVSFVKEVFIK